jgi:hypothetical protein
MHDLGIKGIGGKGTSYSLVLDEVKGELIKVFPSSRE